MTRLAPGDRGVRVPHRSGGAQQHRAAQRRDRLHGVAQSRRAASCGSSSRTTAAASAGRERARGRGRGLGLIGMRERAQALGGTFTIEDREGGGTIVAVTLPLDGERSVTDSRRLLDRFDAQGNAVATLRILLADDHTVVRQGLRKVLEERPDWQVVAEAGDGREAVRQAEQHKPDVAILDVAMPLLNGVEATRQIVKRVPGVRVLVLSMHADEAYVTQILQAGAAGYLLKDSADVDLMQAVQRRRRGQVVLQSGHRAPDAGRLRASSARANQASSIATSRCPIASARSSS